MLPEEDTANRINAVKKYISRGLDQELSLAELAGVANYSPFHFQRIFKSIVGESPKQYIKRLRLEASAHLIALQPEATMLEVALRYGHASLEAFSRAFKNYYGLSPDAFRRCSMDDKMDYIAKKTHADNTLNLSPASFLKTSKTYNNADIAINVVQLKAEKVIYLPITLGDTSTIASSAKRLRNWADARNLITEKTLFFSLMRDFPAFTALDKCRFYPCITVAEKPELSGGVDYMEIKPNKYAAFIAEPGLNNMMLAVQQFANIWLPESGYAIKHSPARLVALGDMETAGFDATAFEIHIALDPK